MNIEHEIFLLKFEDFLWALFIVLSFLNIKGTCDQELFLKNHQNCYKEEANYIFTLTLTVTFFIYIYFFLRNYQRYQMASVEEKKLYSIKLFGSSFLLAGTVLLLYFQTHQDSFVGSPAI